MRMRGKRAVPFERSCFLVVGIRAFGGKKWSFGDLGEVNIWREEVKEGRGENDLFGVFDIPR